MTARLDWSAVLKETRAAAIADTRLFGVRDEMLPDDPAGERYSEHRPQRWEWKRPEWLGGGTVSFRSTLEARWAIYFTELGAWWGYEPRVFSLPSGDYRPDFRFKQRRAHHDFGWLEVKGPKPTALEWQLCKELALVTRELVVIAEGGWSMSHAPRCTAMWVDERGNYHEERATPMRACEVEWCDEKQFVVPGLSRGGNDRCEMHVDPGSFSPGERDWPAHMTAEAIATSWGRGLGRR